MHTHHSIQLIQTKWWC